MFYTLEKDKSRSRTEGNVCGGDTGSCAGCANGSEKNREGSLTRSDSIGRGCGGRPALEKRCEEKSGREVLLLAEEIRHAPEGGSTGSSAKSDDEDNWGASKKFAQFGGDKKGAGESEGRDCRGVCG